MKFLATIFVGLCIAALAQSMLHDDRYKTCSIFGVTHSRSFDMEDRADACFQTGPRVLVDNMWLRVTSHTYLEESTMLVDWKSTKVYVEFYGDMTQVPVALFSSDILMCNCTTRCLSERKLETKLGVNGVIDLYVRYENETAVAYLKDRRSNITLSIRKTNSGFYVNVVLPERIAYASSGFCATGCPRVNDHSEVLCFTKDYIKPSYEVCERMFDDLEDKYWKKDVIVKEDWKWRLLPCSRSVLLWANVSAALHHRYVYADLILIRHWWTIPKLYSELLHPIVLNWLEYEPIIMEILDECDVEKTEDVVEPVKETMVNGRMSFVDVSPLVKEEIVDNKTDIKIDLTNDHFVDLSKPVVRPVDEIRLRLASLVNSKAPLRVDLPKDKDILVNPCSDETRLKKIFFFPHPHYETKFIQCDDFNRMTVGKCQPNTKFSVEARACLKF